VYTDFCQRFAEHTPPLPPVCPEAAEPAAPSTTVVIPCRRSPITIKPPSPPSPPFPTDDGSPDPTFGIGGISTIAFDETSDGSDVALCVVEQPDGKLAALGSAQYGDAGYITDAAATRVGEEGLLDASFGRTGKEIFTFGPSPPNWQWLSAAATDAAFGRVVAVGAVLDDETGAVEDVLVRLQNDDIFADGFD
jgi:hypothetical protein